eukprot:1445564-Alexandrium_andersonii.AAC.1
MSASLVGSEMCIRDSPLRVRVEKPAVAVVQLAQPRGDYRLRFGHLATVSYTHLTLPTICSV